MNNQIKFNTFYCGTAILFSNTEFERDVIIKQLLNSEFGEISIGYYRFVLLD